ncbi:MAG TPA: SGNH/GDSL hydrolase family protein [Jatrophihabitans sp.]|nr:SGNH/GDSL hydrolase family protein [Jatrophihabitans sp.]
MAIGDSFTEGVGDELPDGTVRGWADLVAEGLAGSGEPAGTGGPVHYANLAVRGRLLDSIVSEQVPAALGLTPAPTLVTFNGGGNDVMRPGVELQQLLDLTELAVRQVADAGVRLVLLAGADPSERLPFGRTIHRRAAALTDGVAELAARYQLTFVNAFADAELRRPQYWSADRLHLGPAGHRRVAGLVLAALGHPGAAHQVEAAAPTGRRLPAELRYYREHVLPWLHRRVRGRSSGDGRTGKYPTWIAIE